MFAHSSLSSLGSHATSCARSRITLCYWQKSDSYSKSQKPLRLGVFARDPLFASWREIPSCSRLGMRSLLASLRVPHKIPLAESIRHFIFPALFQVNG